MFFVLIFTTLIYHCHKVEENMKTARKPAFWKRLKIPKRDPYLAVTCIHTSSYSINLKIRSHIFFLILSLHPGQFESVSTKVSTNNDLQKCHKHIYPTA